VKDALEMILQGSSRQIKIYSLVSLRLQSVLFPMISINCTRSENVIIKTAVELDCEEYKLGKFTNIHVFSSLNTPLVIVLGFIPEIQKG
jgi:hypothetical protein